VQDHRFATPELGEWRARLEPHRGVLERVVPSVGRIELRRLPEDLHIGTGWMVTEDVIVTNRHVAQAFTHGAGRTAVLNRDPFGRELPVQIDFREEHGRNSAAEHFVAEVLWVEELDEHLPDLALLKLRRGSAGLPPPIQLSDRLPVQREFPLAVVGYPAWDDRNDAEQMKRLFGDIYGVKRLAPGYVMPAAGDGSETHVFEHDCTTLGGNSGSVVLNVETGHAVGLHFAGWVGVRNLAVRAERLKQRLAELHLQVAVPASYTRLGDAAALSQAEPEVTRQAEAYAGREGFKPDFVPGAPAFIPDFSGLGEELASLTTPGEGKELRYTHFSLWMGARRRLALCTAVNIDGRSLRRFAREGGDRWYFDPRLPREQQVGNELYVRNKLDRGHLVRRLDPVWGQNDEEARLAMEDTFHFTNAAPQHEDLNQATWNDLEDYILDNADAHDLRISVFTGPVFGEGGRRYRDVDVPAEFWKVVLMSRRSAGGLRPLATAYLLSQADLLGHIEFAFGAYRTWQVPLSLIEKRTGLGFAALRPYDPLESRAAPGAIERVLPPTPQLIRSWRDIVLDGAWPTQTGPLDATAGAASLDSLRRRLAAAQRAASLDFVAEFDAAPPTDVIARLAGVLPGAVGVEPVFANDPRFLRLRVPGLNLQQLGGLSPFDLVEPLRAALGARSVEPDLPTDFFPERDDGQPGGRESGDVLGCWVNDSEPAPPDSRWALKAIRVDAAWEFSRRQNRPVAGSDVLVAQPDTGVTNHPELAGALDNTRWADLLDGGDPTDPLIDVDPTDTPGHGTATGSVVISRPEGRMTGSAPAARLVPIRCIESVVRITQSRVARAIEHAVDQGCQVITMSLGGLWSHALGTAVERAVERNVIVLAAAGNCVKMVVWPARFDRCIAVGGSNVHEGTWRGSSRGSAVDICAPAQHVYRASRRPDSTDPGDVGPGEGTSFAVALTAGVAAIWLAHHGRQALISSLAPGERLQERFRRLLQRTARVPPGWDHDRYGAGIVDALALLEAGQGTGGTEMVAAAAERPRGTPVAATQAEAAREFLQELAGGREATSDPAVLERHGLELIWLALEQQRRPFGRGGIESAAGGARSGPSAELRATFAKPENAALAVQLGFGPGGGSEGAFDTPVHGLCDDPHMDPEQPSPAFEAPFGGAEAVRPYRIARALDVLCQQVNAAAPNRSRLSDGWIGDKRHQIRTSDHNPWVTDEGTGVVTALDLTHDPSNGFDANTLAEALRRARDPRVKYVIWNRRIMSSTIQPWEWRPYTGMNPHTLHLHVSVQPDKAAYDSEATWTIR
jgi:DNA/RNA endonuclease G (NUC1)